MVPNNPSSPPTVFLFFHQLVNIQDFVIVFYYIFNVNHILVRFMYLCEQLHTIVTKTAIRDTVIVFLSFSLLLSIFPSFLFS